MTNARKFQVLINQRYVNVSVHKNIAAKRYIKSVRQDLISKFSGRCLEGSTSQAYLYLLVLQSKPTSPRRQIGSNSNITGISEKNNPFSTVWLGYRLQLQAVLLASLSYVCS